MNTIKIAGILLILAGTAGLAYHSFSYTRATHQAQLGPIELTVKEKETVDIPVWAGVGAILLGGLVLAVGGRKR